MTYGRVQNLVTQVKVGGLGSRLNIVPMAQMTVLGLAMLPFLAYGQEQ